ncbi:MAG: maltose ABC transporter substrate-binding protein [Candidatus Bipolaricaulota bacterium]|nr:maltose ABC transporter substrate-binding protein [Candidatus Bipolaricaulota bacterium]MCX7844308.1 maltose ABC transporter substrate-binding protein [Candidatus Bipolaricaulota bacterium]MDW8152554.1 maltose ABC transporter substrate-binding protein [Candidatus Bipolaricaulota bacterium]
MKRLVLVLWAVLGLAAFAAQPGKILIWADDTRAPVFREIGAQYTKITGIPVEVVEIPFGQIRDQFITAAPTGEGPDLIIGAHDWVGELAASGLLAEILLPNELKAQFDAVSLEAFTYGKLYGLPYAREGVGLLYNKKLVPVLPKTFEELVALARKLTDPTVPQYGFVVQNPDPYHSFPFISALGGYIFGYDKEGKLNPCDVGLDSPGAIAGAKVLDSLFEEGLIPAGLDWDTWTSLFTEGRIAMVITGPWFVGRAKAAGIDIGVAPIPPIQGKAPKPFVGVQGVMVSAFSPNLPLIYDFLFNYFATKATMLALYARDPRIPAFLPAYQEVAADPILRGFAESIAQGVPMPNIPQMSAVWGAWYDAMAMIGNQQMEPAEALKKAADSIRATLGCK